MNGFLGTGATLKADLNLAIQIAMGLALLVGMMLARRKQFRAHKYCQSAVLLLNLVMIFSVMAPSFHKQVEPQVPGGLRESYYLFPYIHAVIGTIAEVLGLYIVLVAATKLVPQKLRFRRYKLWMRTELALWWTVILLGLATYYVWYLRAEAKPATTPVVASSSEKPERRASIKISNFKFDPPEISVEAGTTVQWTDETGRHNVTADDESFKSDVLTAGGVFEHKFTSPGVYPYYCEFHGEKHGKEMSGIVVVK